MAVARVTTWNTGDTLTASALNGEFNNILNNGTSAAFPLTQAVSFGGFDITNSGNITLATGKSLIYAGQEKLAQGTTLVSAATVDLSTATGNYVQISGTVTITSFGTSQAGVQIWVGFLGALTLTYNATSLILPGSVNITTAAGDMALAISLGGGNWQLFFAPRTGKSTVAPADSDVTFTNITTGNVSATAHGYAPIFPNNTTTFLSGAGTYIIPGGSTAPIVGSFTYDVSTSSGTQVISPTGMTIAPRLVLFSASVPAVTGYLSYNGYDSLTQARCVYSRDVSNNFQHAVSTTASIFLQAADGTSAAANITSSTTSSYTLTWTKVGSPTGTATVLYTVFF